MPTLADPMERNLFFYEQFTQETVKKISESIVNITSSDDKIKKQYSIYGLEYKPSPIKLHIDSYGGSVYNCLGLISLIEKNETKVQTIVTGCAMSAGFLTLISGSKRFAYDKSTIMVHSLGFGSWGKISEVEESLQEAQRLDKILENIILEKTKISKDLLRKIRKEKFDWHMCPKEALKYGIIDQIL